MEEAEIVELNVGGTHYCSTRCTLAGSGADGGMLAALLASRNRGMRKHDGAGRVFIDRDGKLFRHVLGFLRDGVVALPANSQHLEALLLEAEFFALEDMADQIRALLKKRDDAARREAAPDAASVSETHMRGKRRQRTVSLESETSEYSEVDASLSSDSSSGSSSMRGWPESADSEPQDPAPLPVVFDQTLFSEAPSF